MDRPTGEDIELFVDTTSLYRNKRGPIWGRVYLSVGDTSFPDAGWTDIAVGFCVAWLHAIRQLASKQTTAETVFFMDGPFRADMKLRTTESVELVFVDFHTPETIEHRSEQRIATLLRNAIISGESVLNSAKERGWGGDADVQALRSEMGAAEELLRP